MVEKIRNILIVIMCLVLGVFAGIGIAHTITSVARSNVRVQDSRDLKRQYEDAWYADQIDKLIKDSK